MSAEAIAETLPGCGAEAARTRKILRFSIGVTLTMALATAIAWPVSFLSAVLIGLLLSSPTPLSLRTGFAFVAVVAIAMALSVVLAAVLVPHPLVFLAITGLLLFRIFHAASGGGNPLAVLWMIIGLLLVPLLMMSAPVAGLLIGVWITFGAMVAVGLALLVQALIPEPPTVPDGPASAPVGGAPDPATRFRAAAISTLAIMPLMVVFYVFQLTQHIVVLIFAAILAITANSTTGSKMGVGLLVANIGGGVLTLVIYNLLVAAPDLQFFVALMFLTALLVAQQRFSDKPNASLYGSALNTVIIVIGSVTTSTAEADTKVYLRLIQIGLAVVYIVAAVGLLEALWPQRAD